MNIFARLDEALKDPGTPTCPLLTEEQTERLQAELAEIQRRDMETLSVLGPQVFGHEVF